MFDGEFEGENEMEGEELAFYSLCMKAVEPAATSQSKIRHLHRCVSPAIPCAKIKDCRPLH